MNKSHTQRLERLLRDWQESETRMQQAYGDASPMTVRMQQKRDAEALSAALAELKKDQQ